MSDLSLKLGADTNSFRTDIAAAGDHASNTIDKLSHSMEHKFFGMRHITGALSTALGLNFEKLGEKAAEVFTGMSESLKEAYKEMERVSNESTEAVIDDIREQASEETKLKLLLLERERIMKRIAEGRTADIKEEPSWVAKLKLWASSQGGLIGMLGDNGQAFKEEDDIQEKLAKDKQMTELAKVNKKIRTDTHEEQKKADEHRRENLRAEEEFENEMRTLEERRDKLKFDQMSKEEKLAYLEKDMTKQLAIQNDAHATQEDRLKAEIKALEDKKQITALTTEEEKKQTAEHEKRAGFAVRGHSQFQNASDEALKDLIHKKRNEANRPKDLFDFTSGIAHDYATAMAAADADAAEKELKMRQGLRQQIGLQGVDAARRGFKGDSLQFDSLLQLVQRGGPDQTTNGQILDHSKKTAMSLDTISKQLANAGLTP